MHLGKAFCGSLRVFATSCGGDAAKGARRAIDAAILGCTDAANGDSWSSSDFRERPLLQSATGRFGWLAPVRHPEKLTLEPRSLAIRTTAC
jgi:hypothetical protein